MKGELEKRAQAWVAKKPNTKGEHVATNWVKMSDIEKARKEFPQELLLILKNMVNVGEGVYRLYYEESKELLEWFLKWFGEKP